MKTIGALCVLALSAQACSTSQRAEADPPEPVGIRGREAKPLKTPAPEKSLGVTDLGVFSDLDERVQLRLPDGLGKSGLRAIHDAERSQLVLFDGDWPLKIYPTNGEKTLRVGEAQLSLRPGDAGELAPLLRSAHLKVGAIKAANDRDGDGIPDVLDLLLGATKTVHNGASYGGGYKRIDFPGGDIPREDGVCTDVVVRAVRNAGLDIQAELQRDIRRSPRSFPMVKKRNPNIDHRRVKTLLPYFVRQWEAHVTELESAEDPLRPGDIIFMDTFPKRRGPDHIGVLSNRVGASGHLLVINNWTNGFKTSEMDLLEFVPVTHRFRVSSR
ncbi:MAG: DUF1287 domain-containing protein [Myxococcales bacterium]|nr:DUF1287 domain-containing protein [Myxococcales bacterium]